MGNPYYEFYNFKGLLTAGIVGSRFDLFKKIKTQGFPPPLKEGSTMQARAFWRKSDVHDWLDAHFPRKPASTGSARKEPIHEEQHTQ